MAGVRMVLVRHGRSVANDAGVFCGSYDADLTPEGLAQVRRLRARGVYPATQEHYSSPLSRCLMTFEAAYGSGTPLKATLPAFQELDFGKLEGRSLPDGQKQELWNSWLAGAGLADRFGVESYAHLCERGARAVRALAIDCQGRGIGSVTVVTHSTIMRAAIMSLAGLKTGQWAELIAPNGLGYMLDLECEGQTVRFLRATPLDEQAQGPVIAPVW